MDIEENGPLDLQLRGFDRSEILDKTGVDVGYHGSKLKSALKGIDRNQYRIDYVSSHYSRDELIEVLDSFAKGASKEDVLIALGLRAFNLVKLSKFFTELGLATEFKLADGNRRKIQMKSGVVAKFGVSNVFELDEFQNKAKQTRIDKYGGAYTLSKDSSLAEKARQNALINLSDPTFKKMVIDKRQKTMLSRYGAISPNHVPEFNQKRLDTLFEHYGVTSWSQSEEGRNRISEAQKMINSDPILRKQATDRRKATTQARYGVDHYAQLPSFREKVSQRMSDPSVLEHLAKMRMSGVAGVSTLENRMYETLCEIYGKEDVKTQYCSEKYPWACDFYIVSKDLYIELNGFWTHGGHWFDENDDNDLSTYQNWVEKDTKFFDNALRQWTKRDALKRQKAIAENLNYLVFWDGVKGSDFDLWVASGCPNGKDQYQEYSWLPYKNIKGYPIREDIVLRRGNRNVTAFAHNYVGDIYYKRELEIWNVNSKKDYIWGDFHIHLFLNRFKYTNKLPYELTELDIIRGISIMGKLRRYSTYKSDNMIKVLEKYKPNSIYDPCVGWGERALTANLMGIEYFGVDINSDLIASLSKMIADHDLNDLLSIEAGDSSILNMQNLGHDMVYTCPPYGSKELYTDKGAENFTESEFVKWWLNVVRNSTCKFTKYFVYQIDEEHRTFMDDVLVDNGWTLVETIPVGLSHIDHFSRKYGKSTKDSGESIRIFFRDSVVD